MQLVILGMHRTGASAVGRILNLMGMYFGSEDAGITPQEDNPKGSWERADVVALNEMTLDQLDGSWRYPTDFDCEKIPLHFKKVFEKQAREILFKLEAHRPWFIKDPRLSLTLPLWKPLLEMPLYLLVNRHPLEVARSLEKRDGIPIPVGLRLWERYTIDSLNFTEESPRIFITYNELMSHPVETIRRVMEELASKGVAISRQPGEAEILASVDATLHHHKAPLEDLAGISPAQLMLWQCIQEGGVTSRPGRFTPGKADESLERHELEEGRRFYRERLAEVKLERNKIRLQLVEEQKKSEVLLGEWNRTKGELLQWGIADLDAGTPQAGVHEEKQIVQIAEALKHREESLQLRAAKALDAFNLLSSNLKAVETRKAFSHDREHEIFRQRAKLIKKQATIDRLISWCKDLQSTVPLNSAARKAQRYFKYWVSRYKPEVFKPLPAPLEKLREDAETRRQKSWQLLTRMETAEKLLRGLLVELEHESILPPGELDTLYSLAGIPVPAGNDSGSGRLISRDFTQGLEPVVSVIMPVHDQIDYTLGCLRSLCEAEEKTPFEVIIVDDFSSQENFERIDRLKHVRVARNTRNLGFIGSCNIGASTASGKYLLFLNNDTKVTPGWLDSLVNTFEAYPDAGIVGSKLVYPDGTLQEAGGIIWKDASGSNYGRNDDPEKPEYNYVRETDYVSGASLMILRDLFSQVGEFDPLYSPAYYEDTDLAFKVRSAGKKVYYQPASEIIHFEGKSNGTEVGAGIKKYQGVNFSKFREKWAAVLDSMHFEKGENIFNARDKSRDKRLLVVIDQDVPRPDCDAGSRSTSNYVELFCKLGFNVKFIGDNFAAEDPYKSQLEQMGVEVLHGNWYRSTIHAWLREKGEEIDFIFANRSHITIKYLDTFRDMPKTKVLYYGHDLGSVRNQGLFELAGNPEAQRRAQLEADRETRIWKACQAIYYPSDEETRHVQANCPGVNARTIPLFILKPKAIRYERNLAQRRDIIFVGGFRHPPNEDAVLWFMEKCWPAIASALPNVHFRVMGSRPTLDIERCASNRVIVSGWVSDEELTNRYWESRMAVIPLRYGAGVKGKVVEALHNHLPVVMTSVAAKGLPGIEKFCEVADDPDEFARRVIEIYTAPERLAAMAKQGGAYVKENFSRQAALKAIASDLEIDRSSIADD